MSATKGSGISRRAVSNLMVGGLVAPLVPAISSRARAADAVQVRIARQYGLANLPLMMMERLELPQKHGKEQGLTIAPEWRTLGGPSAVVDALLSGQLEFGITGVPTLLTMWDKTVGTSRAIQALTAVECEPFQLISINPAVKTIADYTAKDRIAVPGVKTSTPALILQMAAAKLWGFDQYAKLDNLTVTLPHPEAVVAMLSGKSEITSHFTILPFSAYELAAPNAHVVLDSYDVFGGPHTNGVITTAKQYYEQNSKVCAAMLAAQNEANDFINKNPLQAVTYYQEMTNDRRDTPANLAKMISDPRIMWTTVPKVTIGYADFMHKAGRIKNMPASWKDLFLPPLYDVAGS